MIDLFSRIAIIVLGITVALLAFHHFARLLRLPQTQHYPKGICKNGKEIKAT